MKDESSDSDDATSFVSLAVLLELQLPNGAIQGDQWGETDTRFLYCAVSALAHLAELDKLDHELTIDHILSCHNPDGGFGTGPGAESHAAQGKCLDPLLRPVSDVLTILSATSHVQLGYAWELSPFCKRSTG